MCGRAQHAMATAFPGTPQYPLFGQLSGLRSPLLIMSILCIQSRSCTVEMKCFPSSRWKIVWETYDDLHLELLLCRCSLCGGSGRVGWEGKWSHKEPCPMCMGRRYVECAECGGHYHRPMFRHVHRAAVDNDEDFDSSMQPPRVLVIMED